MRRRLLGLGAALAALAIAGCGESSGPSGTPAALVPKDASVYVEVDVDPGGDQEKHFREIVERFAPGQSDPGTLAAGLLAAELADADRDFSYEKDVKPWLGGTVAAFLGSFDASRDDIGGGALLLEASDEDLALTAAAKLLGAGTARGSEGRRYREVDELAYAAVAGHLVVGTPQEVRGILGRRDDSLESESSYRDQVADLPEDRLALLYYSTGGLEVPGFEIPDVLNAAGATSVALRAEKDALGFHSRSEDGGPLADIFGGEALLRTVPADSTLAIGLNLGTVAEPIFETVAELGYGGRSEAVRQVKKDTGLDIEADLLSWLGPAAIFVRGPDSARAEGALLVESKSPSASRRALALGRAGLERDRSEEVSDFDGGEPGGFVSVGEGDPSENTGVFAQRDGRVTIASSEKAARDALEPTAKLGDDERFRRAAGRFDEGYGVNIFVDPAAFARLFLPPDSGAAAAQLVLSQLDFVASATRRDGDRLDNIFRIQLTPAP